MQKGIKSTLVAILLGTAILNSDVETHTPGKLANKENVANWVDSKNYYGTFWGAYMAEENLARSKTNWKKYQELSCEDSLPDFDGDRCIGDSLYRVCEED